MSKHFTDVLTKLAAEHKEVLKETTKFGQVIKTSSGMQEFRKIISMLMAVAI